MNNSTTDQFIEGQDVTTLIPFQRTIVLASAWLGTLLLSKLPLMIARDFLGTDIFWINSAWIVLAVLFWLATSMWKTIRSLRSYFLIMGVILLLAFGFDPFVKQSTAWNRLFANGAPMVILFGERVLLALEALIVVSILFLMGVSRQQAFLTIGNLNARLGGKHASSNTKKPSWSIFGPSMAILLGGLFFWFLSTQNAAINLNTTAILLGLPLILVSAILNALSEEITYRAAPLATLGSAVGPTHAIWLTSLWFGLGHYYGGIPSGPVGLIQTGLLALLLGKAMIDTRGLGWSWIIHVVLDTVIYSFIAMAA